MARRASTTPPLKDRLRALLRELMLVPGLSGYEDRVRRRLAKEPTHAELTARRAA